MEREVDRMAAEVAARLLAEEELRAALARDELRVHYQPVVRLQDGVIVGCEALVRWQHPARGLLGARSFIGLAETNGRIAAIDAFVLDEACRQIAEWRRAGIELPVSFNVSGRLLAERKLVGYVERTPARHGVRGASLCVEFSESAVIGRIDRLAPTLAALKRLGVRLAMDDFGSGFSSLGHLRRLPVDAVKIDGSFVGAIAAPGPDRAIVAAILSLAAEMGLTAIAEHIERPEQLAALRRLGCPLGQGFHFAPARAAADLELTGFEPRGRPGFGDPFVIREFMRQIGIPARLDG
jgi:EAL domain-containing protein (putative c-di-GMP-specific phosphodiesterase class I)